MGVWRNGRSSHRVPMLRPRGMEDTMKQVEEVYGLRGLSVKLGPLDASLLRGGIQLQVMFLSAQQPFPAIGRPHCDNVCMEASTSNRCIARRLCRGPILLKHAIALCWIMGARTGCCGNTAASFHVGVGVPRSSCGEAALSLDAAPTAPRCVPRGCA